jgi:hypothetical protein
VKGAQVTSLIQCTGCWFAGSKYGLSWKLTQALLTSLPQNSRNFTFVDDGELAAAPAPAPAVSRKAAPAPAPAAPAMVEDEEEEEEEEEEDEEEAPLAAPTRSVAKPSVLAAMMPKAPAPAPSVVADSLDDAADDVDPVPVPKKTAAVVKKKIVAKK